MVVFGQIVSIRANSLYFCKIGCIRAKWLYSGKVHVFGKSGCIRAKWGYLGKSRFIWVKLVVFWQSGPIWSKLVVFGKIGYIRAKWFYSRKVVSLGECSCIWAKVVLFLQTWFISGKLVVLGIQTNWLALGKSGSI